MANPTPGPWVNDDGEIRGKGGSHIAQVSTLNDFPCSEPESMHPEQREDIENELKANACLIAESREMFSVLEDLIRTNGKANALWDRARAIVSNVKNQEVNHG